MASISSAEGNCLGKVSGNLVAAAIAQLPAPELAKEKMTYAVIEVPELGAVRVSCVLRREPRWKQLYWSAIRAEKC